MGQKPRPLVLTLGWLGANERHLGKYSSWYSSQGYDTLSFISPATSILFPQFGRKHAVQLLDYAIDLSEQTKDGKQEKRPILFHVFSNNGLYFYANVLQQVARSSQYERVLHSTLGCVFDSTPSHLSVEIFTKGFGGALLGAMGITNGGRPAYDHWLVSPIIRALFSVALAPPFLRNNVSSLLESYVRFQPKCPQLFLYSKGDELIPYTDIELAIRATNDLGIPATGKCWADSPHVSHFRMHPEEYREAVTRFVEEATERWHRHGQRTAIVQQQPAPLSPADLDKVVEEWRRLIIHF